MTFSNIQQQSGHLRKQGGNVEDQQVIQVTPSEPEKKKSKQPLFFLFILILVVIFLLLRPGVFTIQPIGALPEGVTFVYHSRNPEMPFFSSPDGMCLESMGSVSLLCRGMAIAALEELTDRILLRLPYSRWAYLRSTGGLEFAD